ncbi:MAG: type II toxin-antitoxin system prevent-host-death family antitoxin [Candidatus Limnocylindria bacterium]|nr:type II toxin-antitoxin system prevent-host-death family antitoxin [Candidatus Limnocylindria bacterium]
MTGMRKSQPKIKSVKAGAPVTGVRRAPATAASGAGVHWTRVSAAAPEAVGASAPPAMRGETIGVRQLRDSLSEQLRSVRVGRTLTVTDHGEPIAMLVPYGLPAGVIRVLSEGRATWNGSKVRVTPPKYENTGQPLSELVIEMREEHEREFDEAIRAAPEDLRR